MTQKSQKIDTYFVTIGLYCIICSILLELSEKEVEHCQTMTDCHRFTVLYSSANKQGQSDSVS